MAVKPLPCPYSDLFRMSQVYRSHSDRVEKELNSLLIKRDFLIFAGLYQLGLKPQDLLEMNFLSLKKEMPLTWTPWLEQYQTLLKNDSPWFHTARHESIRQGLSRRSMEQVLAKQAITHELNHWTILGLKHAHICKLLQQGLSHIQIQLRLGLSETFDLKTFQKHLEQKETQAQLYTDIPSL